MIDYDFPLYRPPAEANNIIIQATYGCSHNSCTFCSMYKTKHFQVRALEDVYKEIDTLASDYPLARRVFLADGDALALDTDHLISILKYLEKAFVKLNRVSLYATAQNLLKKSVDELKQLQEHHLTLIYFGIETGNEEMLKKINKGVNALEIIEALDKASKAEIKVSATVILGLGGLDFSYEHIKDTAGLINKSKVTYLSTLHLGLEPKIKQKFTQAFESFKELNDYQVLDEQKRFLELLNPSNKVIFRSNHASNALHLKGTLPKDKTRLLKELSYALEVGESSFVPPAFRGF